MFSLSTAVSEHAALFNAAVRAGNYADFLATFAADCVMRFVGVPVGPYHGLEEIAAAYATRPPDDTMTVRSVAAVDGSPTTARVAFAWDAGGTGTMTVRWREGLVADLEIAFD